MEKVTFGAGCFWGVEAAFRRIDGVIDAPVGYAGGTIRNPTYENVCGGETGHESHFFHCLLVFQNGAVMQNRISDLDLVIGQQLDEILGRLGNLGKLLGDDPSDRHFGVVDYLVQDVEHQGPLALGQDVVLAREQIRATFQDFRSAAETHRYMRLARAGSRSSRRRIGS